MANRFGNVLKWLVFIPIMVISIFISFIILKFKIRIKKTNCIIFCFENYFKHGGYIIIRKSKYGWYPHFIWAKSIKNLKVRHISPINDGPPENIKELFLFEAYIKNKDN